MRLVSAVLDREATPEQLREVEALRAQDPAFAQTLDALLKAETRLKDYFTPPADAGMRDVAPIARVSPTPVARAWRLLAAAAIVALAATVALVVLASPDDPARLDAVAMHAGFVANPTPTTVCDTPEKFVAYTREHLGEAITASFEPGVVLVGWRDAGAGYGPDSGTRLLLAYGNASEPVVVLFQPRGRGAPKHADTDLKVHPGRFGAVETWEISRLDTPVVLPRLSRCKD
jgi:hypothetical protein